MFEIVIVTKRQNFSYAWELKSLPPFKNFAAWVVEAVAFWDP